MEGGVKIAFSEEEVRTYAENILGHLLVTKQTGPEGKMVNHLYIEAGCDIAHEYYLAMLVDRERKSVLIMASTEGGMDIEEVAETNPDAIHKVWVDPHSGLLLSNAGISAHPSALRGSPSSPSHAPLHRCMTSSVRRIVRWWKSARSSGPPRISYWLWMRRSASMPTQHSAMLRRLGRPCRTIRGGGDRSSSREAGLSYVKCDGDIGCLVNGAGLAMATMDVIQLYGSSPANFLDVGGGARLRTGSR